MAETAVAPKTPRAKPDARPMRLAYAAGGVAALSAMAAGLVHIGGATGVSPIDNAAVAAADTATHPPVTRSVNIQHVINYVHLKPGQQAPPGARVITPNAPAPRVVVTHVQAAAPVAQAPRHIIITRQSGRP